MLEEFWNGFFRSFLLTLFETLGYWTARILVPFLSLGHARVEVDSDVSTRPYRRWAMFYRDLDGQRVMYAQTAAGLGMLSWFVAFACLVAYRYMKDSA